MEEKKEPEQPKREYNFYGEVHYVKVEAGATYIERQINDTAVKKANLSEDKENSAELLKSETATKIWKAFIDAKYMNEDKSPNVSWAVAALVAREFGTTIQIKNYWKVFGEFWNHPHLAQSLQNAFNSNSQTDSIVRNIQQIIASAMTENQPL